MIIVQLQEKLVDAAASSIPEIIKTAMASPLGIVALLIVLLGAFGLIFFYKEDPRYRFTVFLLTFAGAAAFSYQLVSTQRELTGEKVVAVLQDSLDQARHKPKLAEFTVLLHFPKGAAIPDSVESFAKERGQETESRLTGKSFQRTTDYEHNTVTMTYLNLQASTALKILATGAGKRWQSRDIVVPDAPTLDMRLQR